MEQNNCDDVTKRTVYFFKKYAREKGFWEEYKALSIPLNKPRCRLSSSRKPISFIEVVNEYEPVKLIQNANAFCHWPSLVTKNGLRWSILSAYWAKICVKEKLYRNKTKSLEYIVQNIRINSQERKDLLSELGKVLIK